MDASQPVQAYVHVGMLVRMYVRFYPCMILYEPLGMRESM